MAWGAAEVLITIRDKRDAISTGLRKARAKSLGITQHLELEWVP